MKKIITFLLIFVCAQHLFGQIKVKKVPISFNKNNFTYTMNGKGTLSIKPTNVIAGYDDIVSEPRLPWIPINIKVSKEFEYQEMSRRITKSMIYSHVLVEHNYASIPTNQATSYLATDNNTEYSESEYPKDNVKYIKTSTIEDYKILHFLVCPFIYKNDEQKLYFISDIDLNITLTMASDEIYTKPKYQSMAMAEITNNLITNGAEDRITITPEEAKDNKTIKYAIITSADLVDSFEPLIEWKKQKGVNGNIYVVDDIINKYPEKTKQLSIKKFLRELYTSNGLEYVLLGGDDTIVPVQNCYAKANSRDPDLYGNPEYNMPTDLYYACFNNTFNWDANANEIYGEPDDDVDILPTIFITRAPIRTEAEALAFCNKIIGYERCNSTKTWKNNMLMAGAKLGTVFSDTKQSDSEYYGNSMYEEIIANKWNGSIKRFYDTHTDFYGGENYQYNRKNLQEQLQNGYSFIDIISHGSANSISTEYDTYRTEDAESLRNPSYSIFVTTACNTNAFDSYKDYYGTIIEPCLSESFIRNEQSGIVSYLGCSRYGWYSNGERDGVSLDYSKAFYYWLFSPYVKDKNFGKIVAAVKHTMAGYAYCNETYNWVQYGLNPVGDPEMPIFTTSPQKLYRCSVNYINKDRSITVNTGDSCRICVMSTKDNGKTYYKVIDDTSNAVFKNIYTPVSICVTKQNFIPRIFMVDPSRLSSQIIECSLNSSDHSITISTQLAEGTKDAYILVTSNKSLKSKRMPLTYGQSTITKDLYEIEKGVNTITLIVDGEKADSKCFINH